MKLRTALIGLGKMGLSHHAIINSHPDVDLVAVCDASGYMLDILNKYTGIKCYADYKKMLAEEKPEAVFIATPSRFHAEMVRAALERDIHVFCEKPFCLDLAEGQRLVELAESKGLVNQVGYHYRFVGAFQQMKQLVDAGVIGQVHHVRAEAYGPVVLKPKGSTWRTSKNEGGGCLYDYACHGIDLVNYIVGRPDAVGGTVLNKVFSRDVEDEVYSTLFYADGKTGQICANWSDESYRKMSAKVSVWGNNGKIVADRQEVQIYLRDGANEALNLNKGWNTRYTTELTDEVWYYLRGEEYSAQVDHFVHSIKAGRKDTRSTFRSALDADLVAAMMIKDGASRHVDVDSIAQTTPMPAKKVAGAGLINKLLG
ncbi:MAG: Gfo/Idh/MocA family protein [Methylobacter sp.]